MIVRDAVIVGSSDCNSIFSTSTSTLHDSVPVHSEFADRIAPANEFASETTNVRNTLPDTVCLLFEVLPSSSPPAIERSRLKFPPPPPAGETTSTVNDGFVGVIGIPVRAFTVPTLHVSTPPLAEQKSGIDANVKSAGAVTRMATFVASSLLR